MLIWSRRCLPFLREELAACERGAEAVDHQQRDQQERQRRHTRVPGRKIQHSTQGKELAYGGRDDAGQHTLSLRWQNPRGDQLWSSDGELNVSAPPPEVTEMDLPLIAAIDLPLDVAGSYTMTVSLDQMPKAEVRLMVRATQPSVLPQMGSLVS